MGGGISDLIRYTNGFKLLFYFYVILFIVFDICSTYFICNMLDVNRILKLYFILSENKKRKKKKNLFYVCVATFAQRVTRLFIEKVGNNKLSHKAR